MTRRRLDIVPTGILSYNQVCIQRHATLQAGRAVRNSRNGGQKMLSFANDYAEGAHEKILRKLIDTNRESLPGYGTDRYCESAREKIRKACGCREADVYFLTGGTQTNQIVIDSMLAGYEGVLAARTGHINTHEAGAVEYTGHKVLELPHKDGKLAAAEIRKYLEGFYGDANHEHMVFPGMVYITHPTEYGTLYTKKELEDVSEVCHRYNIPLYLDGARLGYGLAAEDTDVTLPDIAAYCDVFYIGGTKVGALCGEAVVFTKNNTLPHFMTRIKQHGALLAKGRLMGIQFDVLFTDDLYLENGRNAIRTAGLLRDAFAKKGYSLYLETSTNQIFVILENTRMKELREKVVFDFWEKYDEGHTVVRFATSWATDEEDVRKLTGIL